MKKIYAYFICTLLTLTSGYSKAMEKEIEKESMRCREEKLLMLRATWSKRAHKCKNDEQLTRYKNLVSKCYKLSPEEIELIMTPMGEEEKAQYAEISKRSERVNTRELRIINICSRMRRSPISGPFCPSKFRK